MSARSHVCLLGVYDLLFWSAVCLCCSADKCTYIICNQFIEQQAPAWGGGAAPLSILAHGDLNGPSMLQLSHGAASCDTEGLKQTFGESKEVLREWLSGGGNANGRHTLVKTPPRAIGDKPVFIYTRRSQDTRGAPQPTTLPPPPPD